MKKNSLPFFNPAVMGLFLFILLSSGAVSFPTNTGTADKNSRLAYGDTVRIVKTNWLNSMGCIFDTLPCVEQAEDNITRFRLRVRVASPNLLGLPQMRFYYYFPNYPGRPLSGLTDPVSQLDPVIMENGALAYEAAFYFSIDFSSICIPDKVLPFRVEHWLVTREGNSNIQPYPVGDYPDHFPSDLFFIPPFGLAEYEIEEKDICCFSNTITDYCVRADTEAPGQTINMTPAQDFIRVQPNPFQSRIQSTYTIAAAGPISIRYLDAQGKLVASQAFKHAQAGEYQTSLSTADWPAGIYYLQMQSSSNTRVIKLVKMQ